MELKEKIYREAFHIFALGYNQGLKAARDAPSTPIADLQAPEVDSDGEEVSYKEDDNPLPLRTLLLCLLFSKRATLLDPL